MEKGYEKGYEKGHEKGPIKAYIIGAGGASYTIKYYDWTPYKPKKIKKKSI